MMYACDSVVVFEIQVHGDLRCLSGLLAVHLGWCRCLHCNYEMYSKVMVMVEE